MSKNWDVYLGCSQLKTARGTIEVSKRQMELQLLAPRQAGTTRMFLLCVVSAKPPQNGCYASDLQQTHARSPQSVT